MTPTMNRRMNPLEWVMLLCLSVLWGGSFFFTEIGSKSCRPLPLPSCASALQPSS